MADYNINAVTRRVVYSGSAGTGPYAFSFEVLVSSDIVVYFNSTSLTLTTDYTVAINANGTGSVTIVTGTNVPTTPDANDTIIIVGARDIERTTDFVTAGDLLAASLNEQLDGLTIFDQQIAEEQKRSLMAPVYDPAHVDDGGTLDMTLPAKADRLGKALLFNATTGNPEAGPTATDIANAQTNATAAAASATAADASATAAAASATAADASATQAQAAALGFTAVTAITTGTTNIETTDARTYYKVDASGGTVTINLPAIGSDEGMYFIFEVVNVDNAITVVRDGTDYINDVNGNYTGLDTVGKVIQFISDDNTPDNWVTTTISQISAATTTEAGKVELAISSELNTGTDATRAVTPDALAGSNYGTAVVQLLVFDDSQDVATGDGAGDLFFRVPSTLNGMNLVAVAAAVQTAGTTGTTDVQINNVTQAADMLTTKLTIDSAETDSSTAATPAVIDTANDDVATADILRIDVDAVSTTAPKGLLVELQFRLP